MKQLYILTCWVIISVSAAMGQVGINSDNSAPDPSAGLDVKFSNKGFLPPRMTFAQRNAIVNPAEGLSVICTNCNGDGTGCFSIYLGGQWQNMFGYCALPVPPVEGIHVQSNTQIIWNWNAVPIALGYKWGTTNDFASAINMGTVLTKTETGLITGNSYTRYVWAYNSCGFSYPATVLTAQALPCGSSFTVSHQAGNVAPVAKTVTYGTVTNIPGETSKCWITRNLGATQQPNTVNESTEPAAGWYWQFNRKQGYKNDGTAVVPAWTITTINENADWDAANDPCALLLGSAWRIPTSTEWNNVNATGNWVNWYGPWGSGLQMHAAGSLNAWDGLLYFRGVVGYYWSSTQSSGLGAWYLSFSNGVSTMFDSHKVPGLSLRCVRDS